jgi:hypothetical protein
MYATDTDDVVDLTCVVVAVVATFENARDLPNLNLNVWLKNQKSRITIACLINNFRAHR